MLMPYFYYSEMDCAIVVNFSAYLKMTIGWRAINEKMNENYN